MVSNILHMTIMTLVTMLFANESITDHHQFHGNISLRICKKLFLYMVSRLKYTILSYLIDIYCNAKFHQIYHKEKSLGDM